MDFKELEYLVQIAHYKNITKAAQKLGITQPSLSRFLIQLEKNLQLKLFSKVGNQLQLTYTGKCYLETAKQILDTKNQLDNKLKDLVALKEGEICIGTTPTRGQYILPNILPAFRKKYPNYNIKIYEENVETLEELLLNGTIHIALFTTTDKEYSAFEMKKICQEEILLCLSSNSPYAKQGVWRKEFRYPWIELRKLQDELFLVLDPKLRLGQCAIKLFEKLGIAPKTIRLSNLETAVILAAEDFGVCLCSDICVPFCKTTNRPLFFSVGEKDFHWDFVVAWRKNAYVFEAMADLIAIVQSIFSQPIER